MNKGVTINLDNNYFLFLFFKQSNLYIVIESCRIQVIYKKKKTKKKMYLLKNHLIFIPRKNLKSLLNPIQLYIVYVLQQKSNQPTSLNFLNHNFLFYNQFSIILICYIKKRIIINCLQTLNIQQHSIQTEIIVCIFLV